MGDEIWEAFRRTRVRVEIPGGWLDVRPMPFEHRGTFPVDASSPLFLITAWNPQGRQSTAEANALAASRLDARVQRLRGVSVRRVIGYGDGLFDHDGTWREEGVGVGGIDRSCAIDLACAFDQRAIFEWHDSVDGFRLVACDGSADEPRGWITDHIGDR